MRTLQRQSDGSWKAFSKPCGCVTALSEKWRSSKSEQVQVSDLPTIRPLSPDKRGCDRRIGPGGLAGGMSCMRFNDLGRYGKGSFGYAEGLRRSENPRRTRRSPRSRGPVSRSAKSGHDRGVLNEVNHPEVMVAKSETTISKSGQFNSIPFEHSGGLPHSL
jgi:hypothetical protein